MFNATAELLTRSMVEALIIESAAELNVTVSPAASPRMVLPVIFKAPPPRLLVVVIELPVLIEPNPVVIDPDVRAPTEASDDEVTPVPKALAVKTLVPAILKADPVDALISPATSNLNPGAVVPIPTRLFELSTSKRLLMLNAVVLVFNVNPTSPDVAVKFKAPVVSVNPLEAVKVEENRPVPATSSLVPGAVVPIPTLELSL